MLFKETVEKYDQFVEEALDALFDSAFKNQKNENDLLLIIANGSKNDYPPNVLSKLKISNYQIGQDFMHFRYISFYHFINQYIQIISKGELPSKFETKEAEKLFYETMIQMQLLCYMKFWETDLIIKRLYNLSRLSRGIEYCWDFNQSLFNNRRKVIKEEILKPIKQICPSFFSLIEGIYSNQIRNAIAHSQYHLLFERIELTNKDQNRFYKLDSITYENWDRIFTQNILTHIHFVNSFNKYYKYYVDKTIGKQNGLLIYFPEKNDLGLNKSAWIKYDMEKEIWYW